MNLHYCCRSNTFDKETPWTESEKIRVCVRKRPLCLREVRRGEVNIITVKDKETLLLHEKKEAVDLTQYILQVTSSVKDCAYGPVTCMGG